MLLGVAFDRIPYFIIITFQPTWVLGIGFKRGIAERKSTVVKYGWLVSIRLEEAILKNI